MVTRHGIVTVIAFERQTGPSRRVPRPWLGRFEAAEKKNAANPGFGRVRFVVCPLSASRNTNEAGTRRRPAQESVCARARRFARANREVARTVA